MEANPPTSPAWIYKRDGRLVPFEADKISRALFAATESLNAPDAFLARELTDGVVHFLTADLDNTIPHTVQVAETVVKVVREFGRPALANAFEAGAESKRTAGPTQGIILEPRLPDLVSDCVRAYTLENVFARDLVAAHKDGLLTLTGLETPLELAACAVDKPRFGGWTEALIDARAIAGGIVAVEGLEYDLESEPNRSVARLVNDLALGRRATALSLVVNLNVAKPPSWADELAAGPLFNAQRRPPDPQRLAMHGDMLLEKFLGQEVGSVRANPASIKVGGTSEIGEYCREVRPLLFPSISLPPVRIDWHLTDEDFVLEARERLRSVARHALVGAPLAFVFDRPRRPIVLAEGMDRKHQAVLLIVGLNLPRLLDQPGVCRDPELFLKKLGSLARLALSAGVQKRDFLRRHAADRPLLTQGFLLDRARLVAAPIGLEATVRALSGAGLCEPVGLEMGKRIVEGLKQVLHQDGLARRLHVRIDSPFCGTDLLRTSAGPSSWDATAPVKSQIKAAGALQAIAESGTAPVCLTGEETPTADQLVEWLHGAWTQSEIVRLQLIGASIPARQLTLRTKGGVT